MNRLATIPALVLASVPLLAGIAAANNNTVTANCTDGLAFVMPRGEEGTVVTASLDGQLVRGPFTIARQGDSLAFTSPNPDPTRPHSWTVVVDSRWNDDMTIVRTVPACVAATSTTSSSTTSTTSTTVAVTTPPVPSTPTTVVTPPRATTTTTTAAPPVVPTGSLPATGRDMTLPVLVAVIASLAGLSLRHAARRSPK